jgi:hypothetical protein
VNCRWLFAYSLQTDVGRPLVAPEFRDRSAAPAELESVSRVL